MGFFSRLFTPRGDGKAVDDDWTSLPDSNASELVVMGDEAAKLLAEIDIDAAIASHERWLPWRAQVLEGARDERLPAVRVQVKKASSAISTRGYCYQ
ncbi:hypothetical protein [Acidovorax sp. SUPP3334]|uniref:hypothetical protein n=1 Tax=Acidovorax sp. SUPP3334 TaxID=2920881 RepID=UPI0023DE48F4|nr:hypothetical protein [Acidovorax sp. SUPP3334]GKT23658.1 hypothetical protein AVHM3334_12340 [Acidovorax sp. SUPP3334]